MKILFLAPEAFPFANPENLAAGITNGFTFRIPEPEEFQAAIDRVLTMFRTDRPTWLESPDPSGHGCGLDLGPQRPRLRPAL